MEAELQNRLLALARAVLENRLLDCRHDLESYRCAEFENRRGLFVTLMQQGRLRGCVGQIEAENTIYDNTIRLTKSAAFKDCRFSPLTEEELQRTTIEISLLTKPRELTGDDIRQKIGRIRPYIDGVILKSGRRNSTFLPQVWESIATPEEFVGELCRKAGLSKDYWQNQTVELSVYQVEHFREADRK